MAADAALIVSELVTNSVIHAGVDSLAVLVLELTTLDDRLRIAVIDHGSHLKPRIRRADAGSPGGFGLRLVDEMSSAWGVVHDTGGTTRVWCDLVFARALNRDGSRHPIVVVAPAPVPAGLS